MSRFAFAMILGLMSGPVYAQDPLTDAINATRRAYGLRDLIYDAGLAGWAETNNQQQHSRGMGHFVMGPAARQNAAWGQQTVQAVVGAWVASPGHLAGMLDATISYSGGSFSPPYWTWNGSAVPVAVAQEPPPVAKVPPAKPEPPAPPQKVLPPTVAPTPQVAYPVTHTTIQTHRGFHPLRGIGRAFRRIACN